MNTETTTDNEVTVVTTAMNTEGVELAAFAKKRLNRDRREFHADIEDGGFVVRLGKLMFELDVVKQGERITSAMLKAAGISAISSALRSECKWFVDNETEAREFIKASKKGFTNVSALKSAMAKAAKVAAKAADTADAAESEPTEDAAKSAAEEKARVLEKLDVPTIAVAIHALAHRTGRDVADILDELVGIFAETDADSYFVEDRNAA
jgi:hypothetical protein